jgi:hypothetical protein
MAPNTRVSKFFGAETPTQGKDAQKLGANASGQVADVAQPLCAEAEKTETPVKTKNSKKRTMDDVSANGPIAPLADPAKRPKAQNTLLQMFNKGQAPPPAGDASHSDQAIKMLSSTLPSNNRKIATPMAMQSKLSEKACDAKVDGNIQQPASATHSADHTTMYDFKVGEVNFTCTCTCDPQVASTWSDILLKEAHDCSNSVGKASVVLGLDCEWAPPWHRGPDIPDRLATLQLFHHASTGGRALVFRLAGLCGQLPSSVAQVLSEERVAKVGANIAGDAQRLVRDFGEPVKGLYDLCRLDKKPGQKLQKKASLEDVVRNHCPESMHVTKADAVMEKGVRTGNWEAWPLSSEQVEYAAKDAALAVMAFVHRFGINASMPQLSTEAAQALVDLEEVHTANESKATAKAKLKKSGSKKGVAEAEDEKENIGAEDESQEPTKKDHKNFFQAMRNSVLSPPNLGKKDHPQGPKDALASVCIVVSGVLDSFERKDMEAYVKEHGGKVSKSVTNKVTHLVTDHGEAGPSKLTKCKELNIPCVSEDVILKMVEDAVSK